MVSISSEGLLPAWYHVRGHHIMRGQVHASSGLSSFYISRHSHYGSSMLITLSFLTPQTLFSNAIKLWIWRLSFQHMKFMGHTQTIASFRWFWKWMIEIFLYRGEKVVSSPHPSQGLWLTKEKKSIINLFNFCITLEFSKMKTQRPKENCIFMLSVMK